MIRRLLLLSLCALSLNFVWSQSVIYVTNLADSGPGTLRNQITAAFPGDTIRFQVTGTINLSSGELNFNKNLVIDGPGVNLLTISGQSVERLFQFSGRVSIYDMKLLNGYSNMGMYSGGITCTGGTLRLNNVRFENCNAAHLGSNPRGGALRVSCDSLFVDNCEFINNGVTSNKYTTSGGAIYANAINQYIRNSTFESNQVDAGADTQNGDYSAEGYGGAIHLVEKTNSILLIDGCTFTNNVCNAVCTYSAGGTQGYGYAYGGVIHIDGLHNEIGTTIRNCTFLNNTANGVGATSSRGYSFGAISLTTNTLSTKITQLSNLVLTGNTATNTSSYAGVGAIYAYRGGVAMSNITATNNTSAYEAVKIDECVYASADRCNFSNNSSGGLHYRVVVNSLISNSQFSNNGKVALELDQLSGPHTTINSTFTGNTSIQGSAMRIENCTAAVDIINCTMMDDTVTVAGQAMELYVKSSPQVRFKNNIISTPVFSSDPLVQVVSSSIVSNGGNIIRDASFATYMTQPNDMNSANPQLGTFANHGGPTNTYSLLASSPAINLGGSDTLTTDQRGFVRDASSDAGAFEYGALDPNQPIVMSQSNDTTICLLETVTLSVVGNTIPQNPVQYQWSLNGTEIPGQITSTLTVSPASPGSYQYTCELSNGSGTVISTPISVTVSAPPSVSANGAATVCAGNSATITASGAITYSWDNGLGAGSSHSVSPGSTTTYTVTGTDGNGCQNTDQVTITVNQLPAVDAGNATAICTENTTTLTATGAVTYSWDNGLGAGSSQVVSPISTTTYSVTGTDANGCQNSDQVTITVNQLPSVDAGNAVTICSGSTTTLTATGAVTYNWDNGLGAGVSQVVSPISATTYTVTGTDANGCQNTDQVTVSVNSLPVIDAGSSATVCAGNSTTLTASGAVTYSWDNGLGAGSSHTVSPTSTTTYTVTGTGGNGCQNTDQVTVTVNQLPAVDAGNALAICAGNNTTLTATGAVSYSWDNGLGAGSTHTVSPVSTTTYTVTGTDANGCQNTDQITVTVNQLPVVVASADTTICMGGNAVISATGATSYTWNNGLGAGSSHTVSPGAAITFTVTGTTNGCSATDQVTVTVNTLPVISASGTATICQGESTTITATGGITYSWNNGVGAGATHAVTPSFTTIYTVTGTDANSCQNTAQVTITVNQLPNTTTTLSADQVTITANTVGATYLWVDCNNNFLPLGGATAQSYTAVTNGSYAVIVTQNGCSDTSACVQISQVGMVEHTAAQQLYVYPNPTNGELHIVIDQKISAVSVFDNNGKEIALSADLLNGVVNFSSLSPGMYFLRIETEKEVYIERISVGK